MKFFYYLLLVLVSFYCSAVIAENQSVDFAEPKNGEVLSSPFKVKFLVTGMQVSPAGNLSANTGHHHLLINAEAIEQGKVVPADERHIHFGKGQTETILNLPSGQYQLTLQFANGLHESFGEQMSKTIEVTVK
jgi:hypothetical protein